jgi:hypothetical protein
MRTLSRIRMHVYLPAIEESLALSGSRALLQRFITPARFQRIELQLEQAGIREGRLIL